MKIFFCGSVYLIVSLSLVPELACLSLDLGSFFRYFIEYTFWAFEVQLVFFYAYKFICLHFSPRVF